MQNLWTFPNSTDNSLIYIKDKTIYISTQKRDDVAQQIQSIKADQLPKNVNEIHFEAIEQVIFSKNKIEIHQENSKKTLFIDEVPQINEVFNTLKKEMPMLAYTATRHPIMDHIKIHLFAAISFFISLLYYVFDILTIGNSVDITSLQEYYGVSYGSFISGFASFGFVGVFVVGIVYVLIAMFFLNNAAEKRPYTKNLKRI